MGQREVVECWRDERKGILQLRREKRDNVGEKREVVESKVERRRERM